MNDFDLGWIVGMLEGEGCFSPSRTGRYFYARVEVVSTDESTIRRLHELLGGNVNGPYAPRSTERKQTWRWRAHGDVAIRVMHLVRPYMGKRRRDRIDEMLALKEAS